MIIAIDALDEYFHQVLAFDKNKAAPMRTRVSFPLFLDCRFKK